MRERLKRSWLPRLVIGLSQVTWPARTRAALRRARGGRGTVELFFAFDDAESALAVRDLAERVAGRRVDLDLRPVVRRGIAGDPAADDKRRYAIVDARRLARRHGWTLACDTPMAPEEGAPYAAGAMALRGDERVAFCLAALRALWFGEGPEPVRPAGDEAAVRANEAAMARRGPYDTPAAVVAGRWYFAHERAPQIADWLDELGWRAA